MALLRDELGLASGLAVLKRYVLTQQVRLGRYQAMHIFRCQQLQVTRSASPPA